jgi:alkyl sulfatase BDS1-like metallo-beta-lactamase superfamily hydrolase
VVFDSDTYAFLEGDAPTTVHPSLWRQSKLVAKQGLFEVIDMYGAALARGPMGAVGAGLGQTTSTGEVGLIPPTLEINQAGEIQTLDGLEIEFQMAPNTEAPAEMHFYFPCYRALCMAENATHTMHNLLTLRGALVRDPHVWSGYLTEAIERFVDRTDVVFASHHWPTWGRVKIIDYLSAQRDIYAYLHDQTLRFLNKG